MPRQERRSWEMERYESDRERVERAGDGLMPRPGLLIDWLIVKERGGEGIHHFQSSQAANTTSRHVFSDSNPFIYPSIFIVYLWLIVVYLISINRRCVHTREDLCGIITILTLYVHTVSAVDRYIPHIYQPQLITYIEFWAALISSPIHERSITYRIWCVPKVPTYWAKREQSTSEYCRSRQHREVGMQHDYTQLSNIQWRQAGALRRDFVWRQDCDAKDWL